MVTACVMLISTGIRLGSERDRSEIEGSWHDVWFALGRVVMVRAGTRTARRRRMTWPSNRVTVESCNRRFNTRRRTRNSHTSCRPRGPRTALRSLGRPGHLPWRVGGFALNRSRGAPTLGAPPRHNGADAGCNTTPQRRSPASAARARQHAAEQLRLSTLLSEKVSGDGEDLHRRRTIKPLGELCLRPVQERRCYLTRPEPRPVDVAEPRVPLEVAAHAGRADASIGLRLEQALQQVG